MRQWGGAEVTLLPACFIIGVVTGDQDPKEAGAWNGLGSVAALRGEYQKALAYIDMALEIAPDYDAARQDKEMILKVMNKM